jgi:uncharacterized protein YaaW (UPF0174 family)
VADEHESTLEQRTRQLGELLQETRVVVAGVQVLFAFLLAVSFQARFATATAFEKDVFLATMLCTTAATICFIAPVAWHRILFRQKDKRHIIAVANRFIVAGVVFLAAAMSLTLVVVCDFVFGGTTAAIVTAVVVPSFAWFWFAAPLLRRRRDARRQR